MSVERARAALRDLIQLAIVSCALAAAIPSFAQSANKIIDGSIRAQGGRKALERIDDTEWQGTAQESGSSETGVFTLITKSPRRFYMEIAIGGDQGAEACNGKSCWGQSGENNVFTFVGEQERLAKAEAQFLNARLLNLKKEKIRARVLGSEALDGGSANVVELTTVSGVQQRVYFDAETHLVIREILEDAKSETQARLPPGSSVAKAAATAAPMNPTEPEEISFSDYRAVQGVLLPFHWKIQQGTKSVEAVLNRIILNGAVNESAFNFPVLSGRPLPDLAELLKDVDANQKKIDDLKKDYACMEQETDQQVDGMGRIKKQSVSLYQVSYIAGHEIDRLIEKDGKPLTPDAQKKEDARVQKEVEHDEKEAAEREKRPPKKDDNDVTIEDFLRISKFSNPRWERFRGQDVVVFDFGPNPAYKPKKLAEKAIHDLVGVVWIDPKAQDVVRLEARFDNSLKVVGGMLASLQKGSAFVFEQTPVGHDVWLPSYDEVHFGVKLLMIKTLRADEIDRYYDYKRFQVSTKESIGAPKQPQ
jgi:hypothetical protein